MYNNFTFLSGIILKIKDKITIHKTNAIMERISFFDKMSITTEITIDIKIGIK
jgi:hypothetical protein